MGRRVSFERLAGSDFTNHIAVHTNGTAWKFSVTRSPRNDANSFARAAVDVARHSAWIEFARRVHDAAIDGSIRKLNAAEIEQFAVNCGALPAPEVAQL